jgi:hypothetical protein
MALRLIKSMSEVGVRVQITCCGVLIAEAIVQDSRMADSLWSKYAIAKYHKNEQIGGCCMQRADIPRMWDVPVGSPVQSKESK